MWYPDRRRSSWLKGSREVWRPQKVKSSQAVNSEGTWALQNVGPWGLDMWWCFVRGNGMYLHGQIPQSQGLSQIRGITVFELAELTWVYQGLGNPRSQYSGRVCVRVCVASGLPGPADCSIAHLHMHTVHRDCQFFVRGWSSQIVGRAGTHMLYSHSTNKVLTSYTVRWKITGMNGTCNDVIWCHLNYSLASHHLKKLITG